MVNILQPFKPPSTPPDREVVLAPSSTPVLEESPRPEVFDSNGGLSSGGDPSRPLPGPSRLSTYSMDDESPSETEHPKKKRIRSTALWKRVQPLLVLENSGSVARDHLASERTFLAYVRTSLAIASTGVALVQLFTIAVNTTSPAQPASFAPASKQLQAFARPLGATTVLFGLIVLIIGMTRYFSVQTALTKGMFPVARVVMMGITVVLGVLVAIVFGVLVAERSTVRGGS